MWYVIRIYDEEGAFEIVEPPLAIEAGWYGLDEIVAGPFSLKADAWDAVCF